MFLRFPYFLRDYFHLDTFVLQNSWVTSRFFYTLQEAVLFFKRFLAVYRDLLIYSKLFLATFICIFREILVFTRFFGCLKIIFYSIKFCFFYETPLFSLQFFVSAFEIPLFFTRLNSIFFGVLLFFQNTLPVSRSSSESCSYYFSWIFLFLFLRYPYFLRDFFLDTFLVISSFSNRVRSHSPQTLLILWVTKCGG